MGAMRFGNLARLVGFACCLAFAGIAQAGEGRYPQASRIVAIGGSLTEIIYALGEEKRLVARDFTSTWPPELQALPDIGYMRALSPEGVLSIRPDLIVALEGSGPPEAVAVLAQAGIPYVTVPERHDSEGILAKIRKVGVALGVEDKASELEAEIGAALEAAQKAAEARHAPARVMFILSMQGGRILASGRHTAADGIITMAGAHNAVTGFDGYKLLNDEAVIGIAPDVIVTMDRGGPQGISPETLFAHPAVAMTPAARGRRLIRMDGAFLLGFGPRTADAINELAAALADMGDAGQ